MDVRHPPNLARCTIHEPDATKRGALLGLVVLLYLVALQWSFATMGDPYTTAVEEARKLQDGYHEELALKQAKKVEWVEDHDESDDFDIDAEDEDAPRRKGADAVAEEDEDEFAGEGDEPEWLTEEDDGTNTTVEMKLGKTLPSEYLPSAGAAAMLFLVVTGHILFHFMCFWNVKFRAMSLFKSAEAVASGKWIQILTLPHQGKPDLVQLAFNDVTGDLIFEFQRRKYKYLDPSAPEPASPSGKGGSDLVGVEGCGAIVPVMPSITGQLSSFAPKGLKTEEAKTQLGIYGENRLSIVPPTIFQMWREQIVSPIPVFQFFCSVLWMLDEYWQYTVFTLITIVMLEFGTAFQRLKTLEQLTKMSMKPYPVQTLRNGTWAELMTTELVPGDIVSLSAGKRAGGTGPASEEIVPCDCLLLNGSAVVNEASLTGESVPAMKDQVPPLSKDNDEKLNIEGKHRVHTLFSGTSLVDVKEEAGAAPMKNPPPNNGIVCYVLRTGFGSSQGSLMQMIEFSTEGVSGDTKETLWALFLLLIVSLVAAAYVFQKGMEKGDMTTHELLIKAVLIITSVVPRQLPMQMAMAVNTALMALMKSGVMCTEPFRVPLAGKITHCLYDKTGTLTTDTLIPSGIVNNESSKTHEVKPVVEASEIASVILAGCHSLVAVGDSKEVVGDPIETAAIRGVEWRYDAKEQTAYRGNFEGKEREVQTCEKEMKAYKAGTKRHKELTERVAVLKKEASAAKEKAKTDKMAVKIVHRYHFSSQLQRMSVIAEVRGMAKAEQKYVCLVKGSPEALMKLVDKKELPEWYEKTFTSLMEDGMRVLALAYKWGPQGVGSKPTRADVEKDLRFAGFIAFSCRIRNDSAAVVGALAASSHVVSMATGDGPLTALHVAKRVGICDDSLPSYVLTVAGGKVEWVSATGAVKTRHPVVLGAELEQFAAANNLMSTEEALEAAAEALGEDLWANVQHISVFARCSPPGKAKIIRSIQEFQKGHVLMCGDGSNDVGALKQADVGLALLSGYGNANTGDEKEKEDEGGDAKNAEDALNSFQKDLDKKARHAQAVKKELMGQKQKEIQAKQRVWLEEELKAREARGEDTGMMAQFSAMQVVMRRMQEEMRKEEREVGKVSNVYAPSINDVLASAEMDTMMVRPGDASVAASFTSRLPTIKSTVDLIRQGRCTLLSALQQQQIMMLESLIQGFTLSALSLEGSRHSERQMIASGWLLSVATLAFSYATPVDKMHPLRPLKSLFHPAIFLSMVGQAVIHIYCLKKAVDMATEAMGPDELASVMEFHRKARLHEVEEEVNEDDPLGALSNAFWSTPFKPNLLNTVVFLVSTAQNVAVLFVNYKGRPWMKGVTENHALFLSLFTTFAGIAYIAWGFSPEINAMFHFYPFPDDEFRWTTVYLVALAIFGTFAWDRLATAVFAPEIFKVMCQEAAATRLSDVYPIFSTLGKVAAGFLALGAVNPLLLIGLYWAYRNMTKKSLGDE
eukprot:TRINITY_DN6102_c1_g4_i1.p1 TRINITY_DN6102_c1_g4~~TRINITY_DN6102_c1_g4_i1.p1  ORF type:complete len:1481 (+),score=675.29 TRINITY_DN6102_c1_g4_i1:75-4517(+)